MKTVFRKKPSKGRHFLADFFGVDKSKLRNRTLLMRQLKQSLLQAGFHVIREAGSFKFKSGGQGVTGFVLLAESHAAFHSYPENGYMALDVYSCGQCNPGVVIQAMSRYLRPKKIVRTVYFRGYTVSDRVINRYQR